MIILPKGCFTVIPDKKEEKTSTGLYLAPTDVKEPDTGRIAFTSEDLKDRQSMKVRFRRNFAEDIEIEGLHHLYFRDFDSAIFYTIKE